MIAGSRRLEHFASPSAAGRANTRHVEALLSPRGGGSDGPGDDVKTLGPLVLIRVSPCPTFGALLAACVPLE
jgi:hypothetical protein